MSKILVVDDEVKIREVIKEYATIYGYEVQEASDGAQAISLVQQNDYDCIILDIMMPNVDGYSACKQIKAIKNIPVIMLSARVEEEDRLYSFELGVDDFVAKPFSPKELMARLKVVINRNGGTKDLEAMSYKGIEINLKAHEVKVDGELVHVTNKEFDLLTYFLKYPNMVIDRETLLEKIWGFDFEGFDRTVDTHIKMLRKNLGQYGNCITTVRGVGYKFEKE